MIIQDGADETHVSCQPTRRRALKLATLSIALACTTTGCTEAPTPARTPARSAHITTFAVVGDSITALGSADFSTGNIPTASWVTQLRSKTLVFSGGYALGGATSGWVLAHLPKTRADVLIVLIGTNDVILHVPTQTTLTNIDRIVRAVETQHILISAIPPIGAQLQVAADLNAALATLARQRRWNWVDPWTPLEAGGKFIPGISGDDIHPNAYGQKVLGEQILAAVKTSIGQP